MDRGLLVLASAAAVTLLVGFAVTWVARRRPWTVAALVGAAVAAGFGAVWAAARVVEWFSPEAGWACVVAGTVVVALALPAPALVAAARERKGERVGPKGVAEWVVVLAGYWFFSAFLMFLGSVVIHLGRTPPGQFR